MVTRVLIVGAGAMGQLHAAAVTAVGDRVVGVVDGNTLRASDLATGGRVFETIDDALLHRSEFDVAVVATPSVLHLEHCQTLVEAGLPVLVEKPHRVPGQSADSLLRAIELNDGRVFVGMSTRHWPAFEHLRKAITEGFLGDILTYRDRIGFQLGSGSLPDWYFNPNQSGGGILVTNGVHALDRLRSMLGPLFVEKAALAALSGESTFDTYAAVEGSVERAKVSVELLWSPFVPQATGIVVTGTRGNALIRMDGSWSITTQDNVRRGDAIDLDTIPFENQWRAFLRGDEGFGIGDLEPTLQLIEEIYEGKYRG